MQALHLPRLRPRRVRNSLRAMSRIRKLQLLSVVLLPVAGGVGYLLGLGYQWLGWGDKDPWFTALALAHGTGLACGIVVENERRYIRLARTPADYVRDRGLDKDNDRLLWLLIAANALITVTLAAVAVWLVPDPPDPVFLGIAGLTAVFLWGGAAWAGWSARRRVQKTGRHAAASGRRQVARAELPVATGPEDTQTAVSRAARELGFSILAERGRTLWLRPPLRTKGVALAVRLDLEPSPRGTVLRACCFPTSRWAGKSAAVGVDVLVALLDGTAEQAAWLPRQRFTRPATADG